MLRVIASVAAVLFLGTHPLAEDNRPKTVTLAEAVKEFNERAQKDATGKTQPALTEDEVVAAIRGWIRERIPATDDVYKAYQKIADTKMLPEGALTFTTKWSGFNEHEFDVWWVDLTIATGPNSGYTYRLRDQKLRCRRLQRERLRPITAEERAKAAEFALKEIQALDDR